MIFRAKNGESLTLNQLLGRLTPEQGEKLKAAIADLKSPEKTAEREAYIRQIEADLKAREGKS